MNYIQAFEAIEDEIDFYYQHHYSKAYFDFKAKVSFKLSAVSVKAFLGKLDEYKFNSYFPYDFSREDMLKESTMLPAIRKMCCAIRILNLLILLPELQHATIKSLNIDIKPGILMRLHTELPKNFNMLREHLNELLIRFHPFVTSQEDQEAVTLWHRNMTSPIVVRSARARVGDSKHEVLVDVVRGESSIPLESTSVQLHQRYEYEDVVGESSCCCPFSFFKKKKIETESLVESQKRNKYN